MLVQNISTRFLIFKLKKLCCKNVFRGKIFERKREKKFFEDNYSTKDEKKIFLGNCLREKNFYLSNFSGENKSR